MVRPQSLDALLYGVWVDGDVLGQVGIVDLVRQAEVDLQPLVDVQVNHATEAQTETSMQRVFHQYCVDHQNPSHTGQLFCMVQDGIKYLTGIIHFIIL